MSIISKPVTHTEIAEAAEHRRKHAQDLSKYRSEMQDKYHEAMERLARHREEYASKEGIQDADLVMRKVLNQKSKLHPKYDGPFVTIASTDRDVYQLSSPNGHVLQNLVNSARLRKLSSSEIEKYTNEFWHTSERLKLHDRRASEARKLQVQQANPPSINSTPVRDASISRAPSALNPPLRRSLRQQ